MEAPMFLFIDPITTVDFQSTFDQIAKTLMTNYTLTFGTEIYYFAELEFYLNHDYHPDVFTHGNEMQLTCNQWYFHMNGKSFKGGNYKGLDITFGSSGYGGILIRALKSVFGNKYIDGPCLVVDKILEVCKKSDILSLVTDEYWNGSAFGPGILSIKSTSTPAVVDITTSARVGLTLRKDKQLSYIMRPYRYIAYPTLVRKGRQHLVLELHSRGRSIEAISDRTGCCTKQCQKWIDYYDVGYKGTSTAESYYGKTLKVNEFSEFYGAIKRLTTSRDN